ncbi:MAG: DnaD domain protein [Anaerolineae bacterium]|nr:DnaD domain protein [Anaerolineae bacterium]
MKFSGFPPGKTRFTPIPDLFFAELLPAIDDLAELKVTLYMFWFLNRQRGYPRYMTMAELEAEGVLMRALEAGAEGQNPVELLHQAVARAVQRGTLLQLSIEDEEGTTDYLFLNTPQGRKAVQEVKRGELVLDKVGPVREPYVPRPRPNIFTLYEENIGLLRPLLVEELEEAAATYPAEWIEEAFRIAVERNVRNWRYIKRILERWATEGKDDGSRFSRPRAVSGPR